MTIPYDTIHPKLHSIVRALNALGAQTTGSCYGMQDEDGNDTDGWYVEIVIPRNCDGWATLTRISRIPLDTEAMLFVWPVSGGVSFQLHGHDADIAAIERGLA